MNQSTSDEKAVSLTVAVVLNEIFDLTQIDPCFISPDDSFLEQLGVHHQDVQILFQRSAYKLSISLTEEQLQISSSKISTPRELVNYLQECQANSFLKAG